MSRSAPWRWWPIERSRLAIRRGRAVTGAHRRQSDGARHVAGRDGSASSGADPSMTPPRSTAPPTSSSPRPAGRACRWRIARGDCRPGGHRGDRRLRRRGGGDAAAIVPREDPDGAGSGAIDALLRDPARRRELGRAARAQQPAVRPARSTMRGNLQLWSELSARRGHPSVSIARPPPVDGANALDRATTSPASRDRWRMTVLARRRRTRPSGTSACPGSPYTGSTLLGMLMANHPSARPSERRPGLTAKVDLDTYVCSCGTRFLECGFCASHRRTGPRDAGTSRSRCSRRTTGTPTSGSRDRRWLNGIVVSSLGNAGVDTPSATRRSAGRGRCADAYRRRGLASMELGSEPSSTKRTGAGVRGYRSRPSTSSVPAGSPRLDVKVSPSGPRSTRGNSASIMKHTGVDVTQAARRWRHANAEADRLRRSFLPRRRMDGAPLRGAVRRSPKGPSTGWRRFIGVEPVPVVRLPADDPSSHAIGNSMRLSAVSEIREDRTWTETTERGRHSRRIARVAGSASHHLRVRLAMSGLRRVLVFIHINKTAGTTLRYILRSSYGARHCDVEPVARARGRTRRFSTSDLAARPPFYPRLASIAGHRISGHTDLEEARAPTSDTVTFLRRADRALRVALPVPPRPSEAERPVVRGMASRRTGLATPRRSASAERADANDAIAVHPPEGHVRRPHGGVSTNR